MSFLELRPCLHQHLPLGQSVPASPLNLTGGQRMMSPPSHPQNPQQLHPYNRHVCPPSLWHLAFTINSIHMEILPKNEVQNGENLTLQCIVDVSTTSLVKPQHLMLFYKNDVLFHNISTMKNTENHSIPEARVYDSGTYKCTVILNNKEKTSIEYQVFVRGECLELNITQANDMLTRGVPSPRVTLDKKEAIEGGVVKVNCSVPEERPPIHFTIEKYELNVKGAKQKRQKTSHNQNFVMLEFPVEEQDHIISFHCQANIVSGTHVESSQSVRSEVVTVRESFTTPRFHISPKGQITEGDQLQIKCTIQVTHLTQAFPEIIIQKDKTIVANSRFNNQAVYSVMAMVEHSGHYKCKVETSRISKVSSIVVNITELFSKPKLEFTSTRLDQGEDFSLWCSVPGQPPANFSIQKGDVIVSQTHNFTKIASVRDSGMYTCLAGIGKVVKKSNVVNITVCAPVDEVKLTLLFDNMVETGKTIALQCSVNEASGPITYKFYRKEEGGPFFETSLNDTQAIWHEPEASKKHEGQYYCTASNLANKAIGKNIFQSNILTVKVFFAPWKKALIAVFVIGVIIAALILGAKFYILKKGKAKQMPVEMSRPAAPLLSSNNEKMSDPNLEANRHYGKRWFPVVSESFSSLLHPLYPPEAESVGVGLKLEGKPWLPVEAPNLIS
ncbi:Platelet endothelial cell adhesion molecule [Galemys pyrenaicus]|uniref:Platelet endothelial cell adhesion molecule n=1 Tax=Galemys pyrenaicus TaxID=202257 RepID=A0A8J5ZNX7_GALPY|nr:Platelet endothelial cell adhesion molecule [Galemys pyrenaicus]